MTACWRCFLSGPTEEAVLGPRPGTPNFRRDVYIALEGAGSGRTVRDPCLCSVNLSPFLSCFFFSSSTSSAAFGIASPSRPPRRRANDQEHLPHILALEHFRKSGSPHRLYAIDHGCFHISLEFVWSKLKNRRLADAAQTMAF